MAKQYSATKSYETRGLGDKNFLELVIFFKHLEQIRGI